LTVVEARDQPSDLALFTLVRAAAYKVRVAFKTSWAILAMKAVVQPFIQDGGR
jgi:hypothetical protein